MNRIATHLSVPNNLLDDVQVVRFDITENEIPEVNNREMFQVESTPTLYRVRYAPTFHAELYVGEHDFDSILRWLSDETVQTHGSLGLRGSDADQTESDTSFLVEEGVDKYENHVFFN